mmetsp:Transcript_21256/g.45422  ORF Transcript_21256/g.45422 Transcript_21256/m.45422 type:complete len:377 (+) Transcript_21256:42-1172(+)
MTRNNLRPLPVLTEVNICIINFAFAILHVVLRPTGLESAVAAFCMGNLFGLILPYLGIIVAFVHLCLGPTLDCIFYPEAYETIILDNKYLWLGSLYLLNVLVALTDRSHLNVEGADYRSSNSAVAKAAFDFWDSAHDYLQMTIVPWDESAQLPPDRQYIFACHPHGIHCTPLALFHCKDSPFDKRFPGICENKLSGLAASVLFKLPGVREFFLFCPYIDASRSVAEAALKANRSLFVCTGSGEESLLTRQGEDILVLSKRKGFIRLALAYGCDIVPVFGVGNSDLFATYSVAIGIRMWLQKRLHISIPIFHGRYLTPLPYRFPVRVLIGEPLSVPEPKVRGKMPDDAVVEEYLKTYIERLKELHKNHTEGRNLKII